VLRRHVIDYDQASNCSERGNDNTDSNPEQGLSGRLREYSATGKP
jgi:hypothetical protein